MKKKYTLESITKMAGTSRATVSRVINEEKYIKENARKKALSVINEVGFYENWN